MTQNQAVPHPPKHLRPRDWILILTAHVCLFSIGLHFTAEEPHIKNGVTCYEQRDLSCAEAAFRKAIQQDPYDADAHNNLGLALSDQGKSAEGIAEFRQAIALQPNLASAHHSLGLAMYDQGQLAAAVTEYKQAIRISPNYAEAHYNLGLALYIQGKPVEAIASLKQARKLFKAQGNTQAVAQAEKTLQQVDKQ